MQGTSPQKREANEIARLGDEILHRKVEPMLTPADAGKFVAIAVESGEFEVDAKDNVALRRLLAREPNAEVWMARAFEPVAYKIGRG
jgi:hypothetical protein